MKGAFWKTYPSQENDRRETKLMKANRTNEERPTNRHLALDEVLLDIGQLLISSDNVDMTAVLQLFGATSGAKKLAFFGVPSVNMLAQLSLFDSAEGGKGTQEDPAQWILDPAVWKKEEGARRLTREEVKQKWEEAKTGTHELIVPVISEEQLHGYISAEYDEEGDTFLQKKADALVALCELLDSYFSRQVKQQAAQESEVHARRLMEGYPLPILIHSGMRILHVNHAGMKMVGASSPGQVVGKFLHDFMSAEYFGEKNSWKQLHEEAMNSQQELVELEFIRLDGGERTVKALSLPIIYRGQKATQMILQDITEQRQSEERYRRFIQTISEAIWCVGLDEPLSVSGPLPDQEKHIWKHARLTECNEVMAHLCGASSSESLLQIEIPALFGQAAKDLISSFVKAGYQLYNREYVWTPEDGSSRHFMINAVGTISRGRLTQVWGSCIEVTDRIQMERRMVRSLEEQQQSIGRDLHDSVGQLLTGIRMLSGNLVRRLGDEDEHREQIGKVARFAEEASKQVSNIYRGLAPSHLRDRHLAEALEDLAQSIAGTLPEGKGVFRHGGQVEVQEQEAKLQLYRIAQEAVNNALKHANPRCIEIALTSQEGGLKLTISDDGKGFDKKLQNNKSLGLYSMQYRAHMIGGELTIDSEANKGTTITCMLANEFFS